MADVPSPANEPDSAPARRTSVLPLHRPWIDQLEVDAVAGVLVSETLVAGDRTLEFEARFAEYVTAAYAVAVSSSWAALPLALDTVGVRPGDDVVTSVAAGVRVAAAIDHLGARPVLVDVHPDRLTLDHRALERQITPRPRAIVPVHFGGVPCEMDEILAIAARHDLRVVEDAAHALPALYRGRTLGSMGDVTVFDFDPERTMTTGEGGILTTDRAEYAARWRAQRADGMADTPGAEVELRGYGCRMTEMSAALGLAQLARIAQFHGIRSYYATVYQLGLTDLPELTLPEAPPWSQHGWGLYVVLLETDRLTIDRDTFVARLLAEQIRGGVDFVPLYTHAYYREKFGYRAQDFPNAARAYARAASLPLYPRMTEADVWDVIHAIRRIVEAHRRQPPPDVTAR